MATNDLDRRPHAASRRYQTIFDPLPLALRQLAGLLARSHEPVRSVRPPHCQIFHGHADIAPVAATTSTGQTVCLHLFGLREGTLSMLDPLLPPACLVHVGHFPIISSLPLKRLLLSLSLLSRTAGRMSCPVRPADPTGFRKAAVC